MEKQIFDLRSRKAFVILTLEIIGAIASFVFILWNLALSVSLYSSYEEFTKSESYLFIKENLLDFPMVYGLEMKNLNENCSDKYNEYIFREIKGFGNVCAERKLINKTIIEFSKDCDSTFYLNNPIKINNIFKKKFCYQEFPRNYFKFYFKKPTDKCEDKDIYCGNLDIGLVCLERRNEIINCPFTDLWIDTKLSDNKYNLLHKNVFDDYNIYTLNVTSPKIWYLSFKANYFTDNEITYYDYIKGMNYSYENNTTMFERYKQEVELSDNLELNNYKNYIYYSDRSENSMTVRFLDFYESYLRNHSDIEIDLNTIEYDFNITMKNSYLAFPDPLCIDELFITGNNSNINNQRGYFSVMSDLGFEFLKSGCLQYLTWNILQIITFLLCFIYFRLNTITDKVKNIQTHINKETERITFLTLNGFNMFILGTKFGIFIIMLTNIYTKKDFINSLINKKCFYYQDKVFPIGDATLTHLNLQLLENISIEDLLSKFQTIFIFIILETIVQGSYLVLRFITGYFIAL